MLKWFIFQACTILRYGIYKNDKKFMSCLIPYEKSAFLSMNAYHYFQNVYQIGYWHLHEILMLVEATSGAGDNPISDVFHWNNKVSVTGW